MMIPFKFRRQSGLCATIQRLSNHEELHRRWVLETAILDPFSHSVATTKTNTVLPTLMQDKYYLTIPLFAELENSTS